MEKRKGLAALAAVAAAVVLVGAGGAAAQESTPYVPWTELLPATTASTNEYTGTGLNDLCPDDGTVDTYQCVDDVIAEMTRRYDDLLEECDHRGLFALAYLRTTEAYQQASLEEGFFEDPEFVNHEDTVFAQLYFDAYDPWEAGSKGDVPLAWQVAFQAAEQRSVTTAGNVLLGISAHINRDLPYALATIGLTDRDTGESRKADHDKANAFLARVPRPLAEEIDRVWDPDYDKGEGADVAGIAAIQEWREEAWRFAERLVEADTPAEEARVERAIEEHAYREGLVIREMTAYRGGQSSAERDAYCEAQQQRSRRNR